MPKKRGKKRTVPDAAHAPAEAEEEVPLTDLSSMIYCSFIGSDDAFPTTASSELEKGCQDGSNGVSAASAGGGEDAQAEEADSDEGGEEEEKEEEDDEVDASWTDAQRYHLQCMGVGIGLLALTVLRKRYFGRQSL